MYTRGIWPKKKSKTFLDWKVTYLFLTLDISIQISIERSTKDSDQLTVRFQKLQQDFEAQLIACDQLNQENQSKALELKVTYWVICVVYLYQIVCLNFHNKSHCCKIVMKETGFRFRWTLLSDSR